MGNDLKKEKSFIFGEILLIASSFFAVVAFLGINLYKNLSLVEKSLLNNLESVCGCVLYLSFASHPHIFIFLIAAGAAFIAFAGLALGKIVRFRMATDRFVREALKSKKHKLSYKLRKISDIVGLEGRIIEIRGVDPVIFCFGLLRPKICISEGLVRNLHKAELIAVLMHEHYHLVSREPVKLFLVKAVARIFFFVPAFKALSEEYVMFSELSADEEATNGFKDKAPLARALYKIIRIKERLVMKNNLAISFFSPTGERISKLLDENYNPKSAIFTPKTVFSLFLLSSSFIFLNLLAYSERMITAGGGISCPQVAAASRDKSCPVPAKQGCGVDYSSRACE